MKRKNVTSDELVNATLAIETGDLLPSKVAYIRGETVWSYMNRLAMSNGFEDTEDMLKLLSEKTRLNVSMAANIFKMVKIENGEYLKEGSVFSVLKFFLREEDYDRLFHLYNGDFNMSHFFVEWLNGAASIKACPECMKEDMKDGTFYYHTIHQIPGMTVCPKHGCNLVAYSGEVGKIFNHPVFEPIDERPNGRKVSELLQALVDSGRMFFAEDFRDALMTRIRKVYGDKTVKELADEYENDSEVPEMYRSSKSFINAFNSRHSMTDVGFVMNLFARFFDDGKDMLDSIIDKTAVEKQFFLKQIEGRFELISDYSKEAMKLRCLKCKHEFMATAYDIIHGSGCPACRNSFKEMNKEKRDRLYDKALKTLFKDFPEEYVLVGIRKGRASILHKPCGRVFTDDAIKFLTVMKCPVCNGKPVEHLDKRVETLSLHHPILGAYDGIPVGDTLLHMIGLRDEPENNIITVYNEAFINETLMNRDESYFQIFGMQGVMNTAYISEYAFVDTVYHSMTALDWDNTKMYELAYWMKQHGVTAESLKKVYQPYYAFAVEQASNLLSRV